MKTLLTILALVLTTTLSAQFDVTSGTLTGDTLDFTDPHEQVDTSEIRVYPVYISKGGSPYIICKAKTTGRYYAQWIGTETNKVYHTEPVRVTSKGTYLILAWNPNAKHPSPRYLRDPYQIQEIKEKE